VNKDIQLYEVKFHDNTMRCDTFTTSLSH